MPAFARPLGFAALLAFVLAACAAPAPTDEPVDTNPATPSVAANGICPDIPYFLQDSPRSNFSLAAEFYRNANSADEANTAARTDAFCAAYTYLQWLVENEPLYTGGETQDDRNFLRLANVYEYYATQVEEADERRAYLDSALVTRQRGEQALQSAGVSYERFPRELREGYFYYSYADVYDDASRQQFDAFNRAFEAQPDSLDDWYLQQLFTLSAELYEDPVERASYIDTIAPYIDDASYRDYATQIAELARTPPDPIAAGGASLAETLVAKYNANPQSLSETEREQIFAIAARADSLIINAGGDPDAIQDTYFDEIVSGANITDPNQLFALFVRSWRRGDRAQAEEYFNQAIANSSSNAQRADFYYSRAQRGFGSAGSLLQQALSYQPSHGPTLFLQARNYADGIGRPSSVDGRAAYWCLADRFNRVAATGDPRVASAARRTAAGYNRAGPSREDYFFKSWTPGQSIRATSGSVSCTTRVR